ncbi:DUF2815 family protein [Gordonibacter sp.]|uniref:DUF2815 family protein n=1 Tax=Gordonibacter sp. TaxID=1968902 RepID=UPI002FC78AB7
MAVDNKSTKVVTGEVRLSYVHLFEPYAFNADQDAKYSVLILIPKSDKATMAKIKSAQAAAVELGMATKWGGKKPKNLGNTLRDGDDDPSFDGEEFEGHYCLRLASKTAPGIIDRYRNKVIDSTEVYSGCYARVSLNFFPYSASGNNGVSAGLNNVQILRDGEPLGGRSRAEDDFDELEDTTSEGAYNDLLGL